MNKILTLSTLSLFAFTFSFGAANDTLVTFSTQGPDRYADGTVVADGECYALVWTKTGSAFAGFSADGSVVDGENNVLVLAAPIAAGGRCPTTAFELNAKFAERYADGAYSLYLVDTRRANGLVSGVNAKGLPVVVNGYGKVDVGGGQRAEIASSLNAGVGVVTATRSVVPVDAPKPVIKAMKVVGGNVYLTVSQTVPYLQYRISGGATPDAAKPVGAAVDGMSGEDIILVAPTTGNSGFFKVGRN